MIEYFLGGIFNIDNNMFVIILWYLIVYVWYYMYVYECVMCSYEKFK